MSVTGFYEWRLQSRRAGARGEAATTQAIASGSATLSLGPYRFLYADEELPHGGHRLTLTPLVRGDEPDVLHGCVAEQCVPRGLADWDEETDARLVKTLGTALFRDVARLVCGDGAGLSA